MCRRLRRSPLLLLLLLLLLGRWPRWRLSPRRPLTPRSTRHQCIPQGVLTLKGVPPAVTLGRGRVALGAGEGRFAVAAAAQLLIFCLDARTNILQGDEGVSRAAGQQGSASAASH